MTDHCWNLLLVLAKTWPKSVIWIWTETGTKTVTAWWIISIRKFTFILHTHNTSRSIIHCYLYNKRRYVCLSVSMFRMAGQTAGPIETKLDTRTHVHPGSVSIKVNVKVIHVCVREWQHYETPGMLRKSDTWRTLLKLRPEDGGGDTWQTLTKLRPDDG